MAGVRCLHAPNDYRNYILSIDAENDPNKSGLIFTGSAFRKKVWEKIPFNDKVPTFEDKDWTKRVLKKGYQIEFAPVIFAYEVSRTKAQAYFRRKNDEIFLTGTSLGITPVGQIDRFEIGDGTPGNITTAINNMYVNAALGKTKQYLDWVTPVYRN